VVTTVAVVLGLLLLVALGGVAALAVQLSRAQDRIAELEELEAAVAAEESPTPRSVQAAGRVVKTAVETVSRVRSQGVRGMLLSSIEDFTTWALEDRRAIVRVAGADGNVTIMFSDIENSTALNSELGDKSWVKLLQDHDRVLHTYVDKHRGHVVKNQGDGYMVVFSTPELAIRAALDIQRALHRTRQSTRRLRRTPIKVRIGLHTGTAIERDGDYFGRNVAMAARVASVAEGGTILASSDVADAVADADAFTFTEEETVELKGLPGEHQLWSVETA
jgi:class 3 adenylate cyclase